jgi:protein transport protein SEC24
LSSEFTQSVFGAQCTQQIDTERTGLPEFDNPLSKRIRDIVQTIQKDRTRCMRVSIIQTIREFERNLTLLPVSFTQIALVRQRDKLESVLRHFLIEDRGTNGSDSYVDFLCYMHKEIRSLLS